MRAWLSFQLPEEQIWQRLFRPYHNDGYGPEIDKLLLDPNAKKLLQYLEKQYKEIVKES